jgi:excisionase family DNA binding protein
MSGPRKAVNDKGPVETAYPTTERDLDGLAVVPLWSVDRPNAAGFLSVGKTAAYAAARSGGIPCVRVGRLYRVPTARLRAMLVET